MGTVSETTDIQRSLDLALRVGEMLLSNGAGAADVTATMSSITQFLGLRNVLVDVTFTTLTLSYEAGVDEPVITMRRQVTHRESDYADLTDVDHLVGELLNEEITREEAAARILQLSSSGHPTPRWAVTASWGVTATGVALLLGGGWVVMLLAAVSGAALEVLQRRLARLRLPFFYSQVAGGFLATTLAVGVAATHVPMDPSLVVTASIVMLLAGLGFIGAFQDALTGFYVTANARILEVMIATVGIIVGVSGGLGLGRWLGVDVLVDPDLSAGLSYLPGVIIGSAITAAGFAFSAYSPARILAPIAVIGGLGGGISFALIETQVHPAAAAGHRGLRHRAGELLGGRVEPGAAAGHRRLEHRAAAARPVHLHVADAARRRELHRHQRDDHRDRGRRPAVLRRPPRRVRRTAAAARGPASRAPSVRAASGRADPHPARPTFPPVLT